MTQIDRDGGNVTMTWRTALILCVMLAVVANIPAFVYMNVTTGSLRAQAYRSCEERRIAREAVNDANDTFKQFMLDAAEARAASSALAEDPRAARRDAATAQRYRQAAESVRRLADLSCPR